MNPKVVQASISVGHAGLACTGYLEIPEGADMIDLSSRLSSLNRYSGDSHIMSTRYNFLIVDRPAPPPAPEPAPDAPADACHAKQAKPKKEKTPAKKATATAKPAKAATKKKNTGKKQGDLL